MEGSAGAAPVRLTSMVRTSGCAAKFPAKLLSMVLGSLPEPRDPDLLGGFSGSDDALVYRLGNGQVCIQTVDFFPPMVDDPFTFGQIAASNALSDIYAMGAEPKVAMNLLCMPSCLDSDVMRRILLGGLSKATEAGVVIGGGHTIADTTPKYGLCVTGFAREDTVWRNGGARGGDALVLTKALGVGLVATAMKAGAAPSALADAAIASMAALNAGARAAARDLDVHAATDVTGFGLLGHAMEMARASAKALRLDVRSLPLLPGVLDLARKEIFPGGLWNNKDYVGEAAALPGGLDPALEALMYDPQTSGGLLLALPPEEARVLVSRLGAPAAVIGTVLPGPAGTVQVQ